LTQKFTLGKNNSKMEGVALVWSCGKNGVRGGRRGKGVREKKLTEGKGRRLRKIKCCLEKH